MGDGFDYDTFIDRNTHRAAVDDEKELLVDSAGVHAGKRECPLGII